MRGGNTKAKGTTGELRAMYEASKRGYGVLYPHGDFAKYDFVVDRNGVLEKVQVKSVTPVNDSLTACLYTMTFSGESGENNRNKQTKYGVGDFDWLLIYDLTNDNMYYVPANQTHEKSQITLRLTQPKRYAQQVKLAVDYCNW